MAHWFHRNPLKATTPATMDTKGAATNNQSLKMCSDLKQARAVLLDVVSNPNNEITTMTKAANEYFSLMHGFINSMDDEKPGDSVLRHALKFRWTNTLCGNTPTEQQDFVYEQTSMTYNIALWFTKHSSKLAGQEEPTMEEAKEVHKCLRMAAGVFTLINDKLVTRLIESAEKGTDLDPRVLSAYINQCTAEAQEVTIARAIELKHSSSIVSSLAYETAKMYTTADDALNSIDDKMAGKWRKYLQFKKAIYYAYAYNYHGVTLLAEDKCGEAIKCLQESLKYYEQAGLLGKEYSSTKGPGTTAKPHEHRFFRQLGPVVRRTLEKCERENGFIYHQKLPPVVADLELKATYGLVAPEEFPMPEPSPLWTKETYMAFDITKMPEEVAKDEKDKDKNKDKKKDEIPPVKESDIPQSNKDPKNISGCVVS